MKISRPGNMVFILLIPISLFHLPSFGAEDLRILSLRDALDLSEKINPTLKAAKARESETQSQLGIAQSYYYPKVSLEAIDSTGFPGSNSALDIAGLMGSPFRSGFSAGVVLTQNILDFGRTYYSVQSSKFQAQSQEQETDIERYQTEQEIIQAYFDCVLYRTEKENWRELLKDTQLIENQVETFINTGQRSIVDRYLSKAQTLDVETHVADFESREKTSAERISVITGKNDSFACSKLDDLSEDVGLRVLPRENPLIAFAQLQVNASQAQLKQAKSENLPVIVGMASFGYLEGAHLLNTEDYSVGIGISLPLFEGFRVKDETDKNSAALEEREQLLSASKFGLDDTNRQLEEKTVSADTRRLHLSEELKIASEAFKVAQRRYFGMQGGLVDVRDSVTNLERVTDSLVRARVEYLEFTSLKAVLNGAR